MDTNNDRATLNQMPGEDQNDTDAFGNSRDRAGRLLVAEQERRDGRRMPYKLTTKQERQVAQDYADGNRTVTNIALDHGIGHATVRRIAQNHGVPLRTPALSAANARFSHREAFRLREAGFSVVDIGEFLGVGRSTVANLFARTPEARLSHAEAVERRRGPVTEYLGVLA